MRAQARWTRLAIEEKYPACFYKLVDKLPLKFSWLVFIDGNNSLKCWDPSTYRSTTCKDPCSPQLDIWLPANMVDKFVRNDIKVRFESLYSCQILCSFADQ